MNAVKIIRKQQEVYGIITETKQNNATRGRVNYSLEGSKSFDYKTSITGKLEGNNVEKDEDEIAVPLKYLSNFWRTLNIPLINSEVSLTLTWSENCVLTSKAYREAVDTTDTTAAVPRVNNPTGATFKKNTKLYVQ